MQLSSVLLLSKHPVFGPSTSVEKVRQNNLFYAKQTQFKPNTNPIKANLTQFQSKTNPIKANQNQSNPAFAPQLTSAISFRTLDITDRQFKRQAAKIKNEILNIVNRQAKHQAIQKIQDIFREKADRLYHWADDRNVPAENNLAERELRPLVIARKISFGSQSDAGARTREILMTVLHTLKKRTPDVMIAFKSALDKLAEQGDIAPYKAVFNFDSS